MAYKRISNIGFSQEVVSFRKKVKEMFRESYTVIITYDMQKYFGLENNIKSKVIYDALFFKNECKIETKEKMKYFLVANRISPEKGITDVIDAFAIFCKNNSEFILKIAGFGDDGYIDMIKQKCEDYGIISRVQFIGFQKDIKPFMLSAKALIVGSYNEGFGMMTAEANMLGCPVIGRNTAGTKEILEKTKGGFLYDSISQMAEYMTEISKMNDMDVLNFMKNPIEIAISLYSIEKSASSIYDYYREILSVNNGGVTYVDK